MRIGQGFDVHKLVASRKLILGGVEIPYELGLLGHSDADVLVHAIMDAILGAAGLRDIGVHFPDNDQKYKDVDSRYLLRKVRELISQKGYVLGNLDATIIAERPKCSKYIPQMIVNIATDLDTDPDQINIKATTSEGLGFTGRGEGIAAMAVVVLQTQNRGD